MSSVPDRLREVMDLVGRAEELLDQAVGMSARLAPRDRELARHHLIEPRSHLRISADELGRKLATAVAQAGEKRVAG
jgi:hypothetical protein